MPLLCPWRPLPRHQPHHLQRPPRTTRTKTNTAPLTTWDLALDRSTWKPLQTQSKVQPARPLWTPLARLATSARLIAALHAPPVPLIPHPHARPAACAVGTLHLCWEYCKFLTKTVFLDGLSHVTITPEYVGTEQNACYCYDTCDAGDFMEPTTGEDTRTAMRPRDVPYGYACNLSLSPPLPPTLPPPSPPPPTTPPPSPTSEEEEAQLVDVNFQLSLSSPARLEISEELNEMKLFQELYYRTPCGSNPEQTDRRVLTLRAPWSEQSSNGRTHASLRARAFRFWP